jgi:hypothetical protein
MNAGSDSGGSAIAHQIFQMGLKHDVEGRWQSELVVSDL